MERCLLFMQKTNKITKKIYGSIKTKRKEERENERQEILNIVNENENFIDENQFYLLIDGIQVSDFEEILNYLS